MVINCLLIIIQVKPYITKIQIYIIIEKSALGLSFNIRPQS